MHAHLGVHPPPPFPHVVEAWRVVSLHVFVCCACFLHVGGAFYSFSLGWEIVFVMISGWVSFPTILLHFPIVFQAKNHVFW